jgi:hypothetical protein
MKARESHGQDSYQRERPDFGMSDSPISITGVLALWRVILSERDRFPELIDADVR